MNLEERVTDALQELGEELEHGERIMVSTIEKCGCDPADPDTIGLGTKCHICNGSGYVVSAKTWIGGQS